ncbi:NUDIX hydrolase [Limibacter armeniacum]|uniref:NUDIX hydrolase n=1 Tax=Limibacter armeniacum TaxID=466084 RepID=UPI002FE5853A
MRFHVNDILFEIRSSNDKHPKESGYVVFGNIGASGIWQHYCSARDGQIQGKPKFIFYVNDYQKTVSELEGKFKVVHAAGGVVSKGDDVLFIYRLDKWDLPKGHVEKGEKLEETAVREVEEECGISVELGEKLGETWHTYVLKGRDVLKCTHWYSMECNDDTGIKPQEEEGIAEVKWVKKTEVAASVMRNTYASIKEIYEVFEGN